MEKIYNFKHLIFLKILDLQLLQLSISLIINYDTVTLHFTKATWNLKKPLLILKIVSLTDQLQSFTSWTVVVSVKNQSVFLFHLEL